MSESVADIATEKRESADAAELQRLREENRLVREEAGAVLAELIEAWGDPVDRLEWLYDDDDWGYARTNYPVTLKSDRNRGQNRHVFETEIELAAIRGASRLLYDTSPYTQNIMQNLLNFIVGTGFTYKAQGKVGGDDELVRAVQFAVDEFLEKNRWQNCHGCREEEIFVRSIRDGEAVIALFEEEDAIPVVRLIEPDQITEPQSPRDIEDYIGWDGPSDWSFGVHSTAGDVEDVHGYFVQWTDNASDFDYMPKDRLSLIKLNVDGNVKRGISSYYAVQEYLTNVGKLERNAVKGAAILSAILGVRQHAEGTRKSNVEGMLQTAAYRRYTQSAPNGSRTRNVARLKPGTWLDVSKGLEYKESPLATQGIGPAFVQIDQATLRTIGAPWQMPEYMISGDASNANYGSTMVAEAPFVKRCQREQSQYGGDFKGLVWKALKIAHAQGRFRRFGVSFRELRQFVSLVVTGPRVAARDANIETNRHKILVDNGVMSRQTWAENEGLDHETEQERGAEVASNTLPAAGIPMPTAEGKLERAASLLWEDYP